MARPQVIESDVAIIGAGAAGLIAARDLSRAGRSVSVIEARDRTGGRIHDVLERDGPVPIALGPEFEHGRSEETEELIRTGRVLVEELDERHYRAIDGELHEVRNFWNEMSQFTGKIPTKGKDRSVADFLGALRKGRNGTSAKLFREFVENYHAAPADDISAQSLSTKGDKPSFEELRQSRILSGYSSIVEVLLAGCDHERTQLHRSAAVTRITWKPGPVRIEAKRGEETLKFEAQQAIVTVPIGVLSARPGEPGAIEFSPELGAHARAIAKLAMGNVVKVALRFRTPFWEEQPGVRLGFIHASGEFPTWWGTAPARLAMLTAWAGGPRAAELVRQPAAKVIDRALSALAEALATPRAKLEAELRGAHYYDWSADPFARGAYSYMRVGGKAAPKHLQEPLGGVLFFAGEATSDEESGTVGGALESGRRAAKQVLEKTRKR